MPQLRRSGGCVSKRLSSAAKGIATSLNKRVPASARVRTVSEVPFGDDLRLRTWHLKNGLRILTLPDHSAPVVAYHTWFGVGSRHERVGKTGLAHFFEHLMFKGTDTHPQGELDRLLEEVGAETNAATWTDWTHYHDTLPSSRLPLAITLEADRMQHLVLDQQQIDAEREVVLSERRDRVEDDVEGSASEALFAHAFQHHPYRWPTIGWKRDIQRYSLDDCIAFYRSFYTPRNATLVAAGAIDEQVLLGLVQEAYGSIRLAPPPEVIHVVEPLQRRARRKELTLPTTTDKLCLGLKAPAFSDPRWVRLAVLNEILFGGRSSRLFEELIEDRSLATTCWGTVTPFAEPGLYEMWVGLREGHSAEEAEARVWAALQRLTREEVSEREVTKAQNRLELDTVTEMENAAGKAEQIGFDDAVSGTPTAVFDRLEGYRSVTPGELRETAREVFQRGRSTTIVVRPRESAQHRGNGAAARR